MTISPNTGPLTTSASVKNAMLYDYGSRDSAFVEVTQRVRKQIVNVLQGENEDLTAVLLQGSGTFAVEAMLTQFVPATGKVIILCIIVHMASGWGRYGHFNMIPRIARHHCANVGGS